MSSKIDLRNINITSLKLSDLNGAILKREYSQIVDELNFKFLSVKNRTLQEYAFEAHLIHRTSLKIFNTFWIGSYCIDFFIPALALSIEIDGTVHEREFKGKVDMSKVDQNRDLGIFTYSIENCDLKHPCVKALLNEIRRMKRRDSRARSRLLRNIYIFTILANRTDSEIRERLGESIGEIFSKLRKIL